MIYYLWLSSIPGIGCVKGRALLSYFSTPEAVYHYDYNSLLKVPGISQRDAKNICEHRSLEQAKRTLEACVKKNIQILTFRDIKFPTLAREIKEIPYMLFYKGDLRPLNQKVPIAIVGARRCSQEAKKIAFQKAQRLSQENKIIVSGMAKGVDSYAHTACVLHDGVTIAVLGNGLDICYPSEHKKLMKRIEETGLLLSQYGPGIEARREHFLVRNRIIAAISEEIHVIEAGKKSGALTTAEYGLRYGRRVLLPKGNAEGK